MRRVVPCWRCPSAGSRRRRRDSAARGPVFRVARWRGCGSPLSGAALRAEVVDAYRCATAGRGAFRSRLLRSTVRSVHRTADVRRRCHDPRAVHDGLLRTGGCCAGRPPDAPPLPGGRREPPAVARLPVDGSVACWSAGHTGSTQRGGRPLRGHGWVSGCRVAARPQHHRQPCCGDQRGRGGGAASGRPGDGAVRDRPSKASPPIRRCGADRGAAECRPHPVDQFSGRRRRAGQLCLRRSTELFSQHAGGVGVCAEPPA